MLDLLKVPGRLWDNLGTRVDDSHRDINSLITAAGGKFEVSAHEMSTDLSGFIPDYYAMYRDDDNRLLGVVNKAYPTIVDNYSTFECVNY